MAQKALRPTAGTVAMRRLVRELDAIVESPRGAGAIAPLAGAALSRALRDLHLLEPRHREPAADRYRQHVVHVHPRGLYSIVSLVWKPGQATPIHDHRCWCVVGVWQGVERETGYDLHDGALVRSRVAFAGPGDVSVLVPPAEDIHRVENAGNGIAISIHVYGADIALLGSSINRVFEDELVRERHALAA